MRKLKLIMNCEISLTVIFFIKSAINRLHWQRYLFADREDAYNIARDFSIMRMHAARICNVNVRGHLSRIFSFHDR